MKYRKVLSRFVTRRDLRHGLRSQYTYYQLLQKTVSGHTCVTRRRMFGGWSKKLCDTIFSDPIVKTETKVMFDSFRLLCILFLFTVAVLLISICRFICINRNYARNITITIFNSDTLTRPDMSVTLYILVFGYRWVCHAHVMPIKYYS